MAREDALGVKDPELERASVAELLAIVAHTSSPLTELVAKTGSLEHLARADAFELAAHLEGRDLDARRPRRKPNAAALDRARSLAAAFELGRRVEVERARPLDKLTSASAVAAWAKPRLASLPHEELWVLALDGRGQLRMARNVARGGIHGASVHAAQPLRVALRADASAFVLVHNHPSGDPTPSEQDIHLTAHVSTAAVAAGIPLLDHVVIARDGFACVPLPPSRTIGSREAR